MDQKPEESQAERVPAAEVSAAPGTGDGTIAIDAALAAGATPRPERFGLAPWVSVLLLLLLAAQVVFPLRRSYESALRGWIATGSGIAVTLVFTLGLAWLVWRMAGRSQRRATIACFVGCVLSGLGVATMRDAAARDSEAWEEFQAEVTALRTELDGLSAAGAGAQPISGAALLERTAGIYRAFAQRVQDDYGRAFGATADVLEELARLRRVVDEASGRFRDAGGLDPGTLPTREAVVERVATLDALVAAHAAMTAGVLGWEQRLRAAMRRADVRPRFADAVTRETVAAVGALPVAGVLELAGRVFGQMREQVVLLRDTWPRWRWVADEQVLEFEDPAGLERYNALAASLIQTQRELTAHEAELGRQVRERPAP